jgi:hypothetical protein
MKKFILVDNQGNTADKQHIEAGKFHISEGEMDKSVAAIINSGDNSPILAVMNYPGALDASMKMFLLNVWDMEGQGYSMIKEVEMPAITADHKLAFAIKAVGAIYDFPEYRKWADGWVSGADRSMESLKAIQKSVENEIGELQNMQEVAYSMGLDIDEADGVKLAQFERARVVFHAAESVLNSQVDQVDQEIGQVFNGIEQFVDSESLSNMSDEVIKVA